MACTIYGLPKLNAKQKTIKSTIMKNFILELAMRNQILFWFGTINFALAAIFIILSRSYYIEVNEVNAWNKPIKFALSIGMYSWTMGWFVHYLSNFKVLHAFNWSVVILLGFEILYIAIQAGRGLLSHYNISTPFYGGLYALMAVAATAISIWTAYIGLLFFRGNFTVLPNYYLWGIRIGIILFVIFSLEGFVMGSRLSHTVGGADGNHGIPFLGWSKLFGDPRVAHFIGMHALQVIPFMAYYVLKNVKLTFILGVLYFLLAIATLIQALQGKPFVKF